MKALIRSISFCCGLFFLQPGFATGFMVTVTMKNNDVLSGKVQLNKLLVKTPYGDLRIPADRITSLQLGIPADHTKDAEVLGKLKKLDATPAEAETAYNSLLSMGPGILGFVKQYAESTEYKVSDRENFTVEDLLDALYEQAGISYGESVNDVIRFDGSNTVEGSVELPDLALQSNYGTLTIKRDMIKSIEIALLEDAAMGDNTFKLKANTHISGNDYGKGWLSTGIKVQAGDKFLITASGKVVLQSLSGGVFGPDGYVSGVKDAAYTEDMETRYGSVVYKVGENGEQHNAGSKTEGIADDDGIIYLSIYETVYNKDNTGFYIAKVTRK